MVIDINNRIELKDIQTADPNAKYVPTPKHSSYLHKHNICFRTKL